MAKQTEIDDAISKLQSILSNLNKKVGLLEQEIRVLESAKENKSESVLQCKESERSEAFIVDEISCVTSVLKAKIPKTAMQDSKILVHQNEEASTSLNSFSLKPNSKSTTEEKRYNGNIE